MGRVPGLAVAALLAAFVSTLGAEDARAVEYPLKAAFLSRLIRYVDWPAGEQGLVVAVLGEDPFGPTLERALAGQGFGARGVTVRRYRSAGDLDACAVLFVSRTAMREWPAVRERIQGWPVLTVGETDGFTADGGIVNFFVQDHRLRFEVNRAAADRAGLRLSSRLLSLARLTPDGVRQGDAR
jgi:hypothetical protein